MQVVQVTSLPGFEASPTLSPDGEYVAFVWERRQGQRHPRRLRQEDRITGRVAPHDGICRRFQSISELVARWPPDRVRAHSHSRDTATIHLTSTLGGSDRKVSDFAVWGRASWSPDGRWLVAARAGPGAAPSPSGPGPISDGLYLIPVDGGEPRALPLPEGTGQPLNPRFSPDGRHLAYQACVGLASCHVEVVEIGADFVPKGPPRRLSRRPIEAGTALAWTRDGKSVLFIDFVIRRLWRVGIEGNEPPTPIELAGLRATNPATAASRDRLVFSQGLRNHDVYRFEPGRAAEPVLASSFEDLYPQFSPDGRRVAFSTNRSAESGAHGSGSPRPMAPSRASSQASPGSTKGRPAGRRTPGVSLSTPWGRMGTTASGQSTSRAARRVG